MKKIFSKNSLLKIILIFLMSLSFLLCIYSVKNYKSNSYPQNRTGQFSQFNRQNGQTGNKNWNHSVKQTPPGSNANTQNNHNNTINSGKNGFNSSNNKFAPLLTVYLAVFLALCIVIYRNFIQKNMKIKSVNTKMLIFSMLFTGLFLKITLSTFMEGYGGDVRLFESWASSAANNFSQFYINSSSSDYPPLYIYVLFFIGKAASLSSLNPYYILLLKLPSIIADMATAYLIYKLAQKYLSAEMSVFLSIFYIFSPAVFIDSALWGQVDSFFTLLVVLSLFLLSEGKTALSSVFFASSVLMKPQGIIFLPVLFFELIRKKDLKIFIKSVISAGITALAVIIPFSASQNIMWIFKLYSNTISEYPYASVNGFNFFNLMGANYENSSNTFLIFSYKIWGLAAIITITVLSWIIYIRRKSRTLAFSCALVQISGVFAFSTGMHERYLFPATALCILAFIYLKDKRFLTLLMGYTITIYGNIYYILFGTLNRMNSNSHSIITDGISLLNVLLFFYLVKVLMDRDKQLPAIVSKL
ncbi:conserved membrane hypothetical protein [Clostridiaceae bacterium BL-3]|nr:conserved membrane hypothetical protein [Clostridiaceae bacterium BL-3]